MTEKNRYFAIVPIHGRNVLVDSPTLNELKDGISQTLRRTELDYPNHDFRSEVIVIKGRKINLPK